MPATTAQLTLDLEQLLQRALSRSGTGAWSAALEAIERASKILPLVATRNDHQPAALGRCAQLLGDLHSRFGQATAATREELDRLRQAQSRLRPTRNAYTQSAAGQTGRPRIDTSA